MRKHIESVPQAHLRLQEHTFSRAQRKWQHVAVRASHDHTPSHLECTSKSTGVPNWCDSSSWICRQRLN